MDVLRFDSHSSLCKNTPIGDCMPYDVYLILRPRHVLAPMSLINIIVLSGREFVNEVNTDLFGKFKVRHMITPAYHPHTNGQDRLRKLTSDHQSDWDKYLEVVQHSFNFEPLACTKMSPYYIRYGFHPRMVTQMCIPDSDDAIPYPKPRHARRKLTPSGSEIIIIITLCFHP